LISIIERLIDCSLGCESICFAYGNFERMTSIVYPTAHCSSFVLALNLSSGSSADDWSSLGQRAYCIHLYELPHGPKEKLEAHIHFGTRESPVTCKPGTMQAHHRFRYPPITVVRRNAVSIPRQHCFHTFRSSRTALEFLEHSCLVAVVLLGGMRALVRASQYLKLYVRRRNWQPSLESLVSLSRNRDDKLQQWAKDLTRVVRKFGSCLIQSLQSIYKRAIPFCPKESIIDRTYGRVSALAVVGISSTDFSWLDLVLNAECA
jgi:hypothetical protein